MSSNDFYDPTLISVKQMTRIALMGCILMVMFGSFSEILYLECVTFTIVVFAMIFKTKEAVLASVVFVILNMVIKQGVTPWSMMYCIIYPTYSLLLGINKDKIKKYFWLIVLLCGVISGLTGQLLQIPFLLVSKKVTLFYVVTGLQTSFFQGIISAMVCAFLYKPVALLLERFTK